MNTTPGELYILLIIISTALSVLGFRYLLSKDIEKRFFSTSCFIVSIISWQIIIYLSCSDIVFDHGTYNINPFIPELKEIAKTSIEYLLIGGVVAGSILFVLSKKNLSEKLQAKIYGLKSKKNNKSEFEVKEEVQPETKPVIKKKIVKRKIVKKPIKKEE